MENTDLLVQMLLLFNTEAHAAAQPRIMMTKRFKRKCVIYVLYSKSNDKTPNCEKFSYFAFKRI